MIRIFAKYNTDNKVLAVVHRKEVPAVLKMLKEKFKGEWIFVDVINPQTEILQFNYGQTYKGFEAHKPEDFRYVKGLNTIKY